MVPALRARLVGRSARLALGGLALATGVGGAVSTAAAAPHASAPGGVPDSAPGARTGVSAALATERSVTLVQRVARPVVLVTLRDRSRVSPKGTDLWKISESGDFGVPQAALRAYKTAAATMAHTLPSCQIPWTLLAGIGRVESDHGRYGGSTLSSDGIPHPAIRGVALNGAGAVAAIHDTDNGRWDGDKVWDRAVGPMQFIPSTWQSAGRDGDGDGVANPNDIDDAALAAADYLCPSSGSILPEASMRAAILSYNHSDYYVDLVMAFARGYRTGVFEIPSPPPPPEPDQPRRHKRHHKPAKDGDSPRHKQHHKPAKDGRPKPGGDKPDKPAGGNNGTGGHHPKPHPSPKPTPTPTPTPTPSPSPDSP